MYYRGIQVAIIVFDVSERKSYESISHWLKDVREKQQNKLLTKKPNESSECLYYIVGNKSDLEDRAVSEDEAKQYVQSLEDQINNENEK